MSNPSLSHTRYSLVAIVLHWLLGAALATMVAMGLYMADLPLSPARLKLYSWHKWAGIVILTLSALRLIWRLTHRPPALPDALVRAMPRWQQVAHHATHHALYALFFIVPLVGWAYSSAAGFPVVLFGVWPLPDFVPVDKVLAKLLKPWHEITALAMVALALGHSAAALKHHWVDRDGLIQRMRPSFI